MGLMHSPCRKKEEVISAAPAPLILLSPLLIIPHPPLQLSPSYCKHNLLSVSDSVVLYVSATQNSEGQQHNICPCYQKMRSVLIHVRTRVISDCQLFTPCWDQYCCIIPFLGAAASGHLLSRLNLDICTFFRTAIQKFPSHRAGARRDTSR